MSQHLSKEDAEASTNNAIIICLLKKAGLGSIKDDVIEAAFKRLQDDKLIANKDDAATVEPLMKAVAQPLLELLHAGLELGHNNFEGWQNAVGLPNSDPTSMIRTGSRARAAPFDLPAAYHAVTGQDFVPTQWYKYRASYSASIPLAEKVRSFLGQYDEKFIPELFNNGTPVYQGRSEFDADHRIPLAALAKMRIVLRVYEPEIVNWYQGNKALSSLGGDTLRSFERILLRFKALSDGEKDVSTVDSIEDIANVAADQSGAVIKKIAKDAKRQKFIDEQFEKMTGQPAKIDGLSRDEVNDAVEEAKELAIKAKLRHRNPIIQAINQSMTAVNMMILLLIALVAAMIYERFAMNPKAT